MHIPPPRPRQSSSAVTKVAPPTLKISRPTKETITAPGRELRAPAKPCANGVTLILHRQRERKRASALPDYQTATETVWQAAAAAAAAMGGPRCLPPLIGGEVASGSADEWLRMCSSLQFALARIIRAYFLKCGWVKNRPGSSGW
jgi:hypothetical protein